MFPVRETQINNTQIETGQSNDVENFDYKLGRRYTGSGPNGVTQYYVSFVYSQTKQAYQMKIHN